MIDRDTLQTRYEQLKSLKAELTASKDKLEKNEAAIMVDGKIPSKYQSAYNKLVSSINEMERQYDALIEDVGPMELEYELQDISANLLFLKDEEGKHFIKKAYALRATRREMLRQAEIAFDLDALDDILGGLREKFVEENFAKYREYAKALPWNKEMAAVA